MLDGEHDLGVFIAGHWRERLVIMELHEGRVLEAHLLGEFLGVGEDELKRFLKLSTAMKV
jgi:hypothetical protein